MCTEADEINQTALIWPQEDETLSESVRIIEGNGGRRAPE